MVDGRFGSTYLLSSLSKGNLYLTRDSRKAGEVETIFKRDKNQLAPVEDVSAYSMFSFCQGQSLFLCQTILTLSFGFWECSYEIGQRCGMKNEHRNCHISLMSLLEKKKKGILMSMIRILKFSYSCSSNIPQQLFYPLQLISHFISPCCCLPSPLAYTLSSESQPSALSPQPPDPRPTEGLHASSTAPSPLVVLVIFGLVGEIGYPLYFLSHAWL